MNKLILFALSAAILNVVPVLAESDHAEPPIFPTAPDPEKSEQTIHRIGAVGMEVELIQPAFTMRIRSIEEGSPAAASGLKPGQIIHSINGEILKEIDPRIKLGRIIEAAEASDGILKFGIRGNRRVVSPCHDCPGGAGDPKANSQPAFSVKEITVSIPVLDDAFMPMRQRLVVGNADVGTMDRFLHHPNGMVRSTAARSLRNHGPDVAMKYLVSDDARVRRAALKGIGHGNSHEKLLTRETFARIIAMLEDPEESWFVKDAALHVAGLAPADWIAPHAELIAGFNSRPE